MIQRVLIPILAIAMVVVAFQSAGWGGVAMVLGVLVMWVLLHFYRTVQVMKRAANRPIGFVDSAVMLNAKLRAGVNLLHVLALTSALGRLESPQDTQPETYRWTDAGGSFVLADFKDGRLVRWKLERPATPDAPEDAQRAQALPPTA